MRKQANWMKSVKVGSVLRNRKGTDFRVVRSVSRYNNGDLACVSLAIRRCSWTSRPVTTMNYVDLLYNGYSLVVGVRVKLDKALDAKLERSLDASRAELCELRCCDVKGMP